MCWPTNLFSRANKLCVWIENLCMYLFYTIYFPFICLYFLKLFPLTLVYWFTFIIKLWPKNCKCSQCGDSSLLGKFPSDLGMKQQINIWNFGSCKWYGSFVVYLCSTCWVFVFWTRPEDLIWGLIWKKREWEGRMKEREIPLI